MNNNLTIDQLLSTYRGSDPAIFAADNLQKLDRPTVRQLAESMLAKLVEAARCA